MLRHAKVRSGRPVKIEGRRYASATVAAQVLSVPLPAMYARLNSPTPTFAEWRYDDEKPTQYRQQRYKPPVDEWVVYQLKHLPSGRIYVGMSSNFPSRKAQHQYLLRGNQHRTTALQELYRSDPDWSNWEWSGVIVASKDEATVFEQKAIDELSAVGLLLNSSLIGRAPIEHAMQSEENRLRQLEGTREYIAKNPEKPSENGRKGCEKRWGDKSNRQAWKGAGNPFAKKVKIDGVVYGSVKDAVKAVGIGEKTIRTRANSVDHPNYTFDV